MLKQLKIAARLLLGFGLLMLVIAGLSSFAVYSSNDAGNILAKVVRFKDDEVQSQRVERRLMEARLAIWMGLATGDASNVAKADTALKAAFRRLDEMAAGTTDRKRLAAIEALKSEAAAFQAKAAKLQAIGGRNLALGSAENKAVAAGAIATAGKASADAAVLGGDYSHAAKSLESESEARLAATTTITTIAGIMSLLLGCAISFFVSRSITHPVRSMTTAMLSLAKGDTATEIPSTGSKDEIGEMAKAVAVFKVNMIEADRLRADQAATAQRTAEAQRKTMHDLADQFEAGTGSIVANVTAQATELQATAQSMASISEETSRQASTVAAASEQATQNVNTVAVATEELSASVREIVQQIAHSSELTAATVTEANAANSDMQALASAMERIGQVVGLISGIAGQTNLLALNATIEAARAGDAGKGFAVVASEVKALANQTAKATDDISTQIAAIQAATKGSVQAIQSIAERIGKVSETASAIAAAVEEQGAATAEIARNVAEAAKGTREVSSNIVGVNSAAQSSGAAAGEVLTSASSLSQNSEALKVQVDRFLREVRAA